MTRAEVFALINAERARQHAKWSGSGRWGTGDCSSLRVSPIVKSAVLAEECGEVARAVLDGSEELTAELVQVAAVAVAWLEALSVPSQDVARWNVTP